MSRFETHNSLETIQIPFQYEWRDIYRQFGSVDEYYLFFSNVDASNTFPIVLLGDWKDDELDVKLIEIIAFQHISNLRSILFITKEWEGVFDIQVFGKKDDADIPHTHIGPIHSAHLLSWTEFPKTWKIDLEFQKHIHRVRGSVAKNINE